MPCPRMCSFALIFSYKQESKQNKLTDAESSNFLFAVFIVQFDMSFDHLQNFLKLFPSENKKAVLSQGN